MRRRLAIALALCLTSSFPGFSASTGSEKDPYLGHPLIEALERLRLQGLNLIFSTAVVTEDLMVSVEPVSTDPRTILEEILAPLDLEAKDGSGGSILIVRSTRAALAGSVRGRVVSASRGGAVVGASVSLPGGGVLATTRPDGTFEIPEIVAGEQTVTVAARGYAERTYGPFTVLAGSTRELLIALEPLPTYLEEIVVTPGRHALVWEDHAARLSIGAADAVLTPAIGGDVTRVVELLPGIAAPDNSAAFNVRGSEARDVSLVLDGLELYDAFHMQDFQSPFSLVDSKIVDRIDVLSGGFTAEFGDRHGGFVELSTALPEGPDHAAIEIGTTNSRLSYAMPTPNGSLLLSARAWYPEAVVHTTELGEDGVSPRFEDAYLKYSVAVSPRTVLSFHGLLASDRLTFEESDGHERVEAEEQSTYIWIGALRSWSPSVLSETVISTGRLDRTRDGFSEPEDETITVDDERSVSFFGLKHDMTWQVGESQLIRTGFQARPLGAEYHYDLVPSSDPTAATSTRLDPAGASYDVYVAHRAALTERFATELGLRWDRQTYIGDDQWSPRANAIWRAGDRTELRFGLGQYSQSQRIHELRVEDGETEFLPAELSRRAEATVQHRWPGGLRFRMDAYYASVSQVQPRYENLFNPIELFPETEEDRVLVAPDGVRLRGTELLLRADTGRPFYWWASYVWSAADDVIDGESVPRSWDQTHAAKFLTAYRWADRWSLSLAGSFHTGWPTTPVSAVITPLPGGGTEITPILGPRNSDRFPAYLRFDLKASRTVPLQGGRLRFDLEVANLTDRENVCCVDDFLYTPRPDGTVDVQPELNNWLGITPSFSVLWEF